ncbi:SAM-dependent chlorinase/fluorinase [Chryseobacterium sp. WG14]|uniref:SAM hydrolase/SAM-dependent halogenase family protein n=1 Tax=unclassified Chryseobacterium TaxID=2593645 RepID=UPI001DD5CBD6|nr:MULTISPECIES: SAM-dependent chlorinase/fluorinase [unclassified Chryseobacterium]MCQ9633748.1 SAM-dependent chlorinase/fluorinase [Chryseobacterium sp. WG23]MCQ9639061.1 SAM-dependent chlorinase/fluorinase [Chryseobacterium sp. WG14]CAH0177721.1 5'-fluoro-5'-deoxy-adenosine synthase [Chryseobacterium sp. Bi04]
MSIITLTSDFGNLDYRVSAVKGKILSLNPEVNIVDITHEIQAFNLIQTSYIVRNAYKYFPKGTIHILAVDSFFNKSRKNILYKADGSYFLAADNGLLSLIFFDIKPEAIYEITLNNRFDDVIDFTSTDIFVPAAVHLANGGLPEVIGRKIETTKQLMFPRPVLNESEGMIIGEVTYIDNFGNIISNISKDFFESAGKAYTSFTIKFRNLTLSRIFSSHTEVVSDWERETEFHGQSAAIFNDSQLLELTIYKGSKKNGAKSLFGLNVGENIYIEFS